jgi:PPK2 family polyphosphate:nucleotide phosphotransferase
MKTRRVLKEMSGLAERYCVRNGRKFRLEDMDPADTKGVKSRTHAEKLLEQSTAILNELQEKLYAQDRWALLLIFQGMDAAGKDSAIKHVMSGVNPQGCDVHSFKAPSPHDLDHDFLWRTHTACPERGRIGIFNRSYYEEVGVTRVHPKLLEAERLPDPLVSKHIWDERYEDINAHERYLARNGTVIRKFFLHLSKTEQRRRFLARLDEPSKNWKFSLDDVKEREFWPAYQAAYETAIRGTATKRAPWYVVPADHKWYTHLIVASAIAEALDGLDLTFPEADRGKRKQLDKVRAALNDKPG